MGVCRWELMEEWRGIGRRGVASRCVGNAAEVARGEEVLEWAFFYAV